MISIYDIKLVILSILIAVIAAYTALDLAGRVTASQGKTQKLWLIGSGTAMGISIWSMHYIGMAAMRMSAIAYYNPKLVILSVAIAISASLIALWLSFQLRQANTLAELLNLAHDAITVRDLNNNFTLWNKGAEEIYGWTEAEAIGKTSHSLLQTEFPQP